MTGYRADKLMELSISMFVLSRSGHLIKQLYKSLLTLLPLSVAFAGEYDERLDFHGTFN